MIIIILLLVILYVIIHNNIDYFHDNLLSKNDNLLFKDDNILFQDSNSNLLSKNNNLLEISQDNKLLNNYNIENEFNCYLYGCNNLPNDMIDWIGVDDNNNQIFTNNIDYYLYNNGFLDKIDYINKNKIKKNNNIITIPVINEDNKLKLKLNLQYKDNNFIGYLTNNYYNIQYLLYEKEINTEINNDKLYKYSVLKIIKNKYQVIYKLPFRQKIENMETIWINYGSLNIGPLMFTTKLN